MKPLPTLIALGAGALALGFAAPPQDSPATEPADAATATATSTAPQAAVPLPYCKERPATIVIRYDPSRIYLTHLLVQALVQPVSAKSTPDPASTLSLWPMGGAASQPPGVFISQVFLSSEAPEDPEARERLLSDGILALNEVLISRLTLPSIEDARKAHRDAVGRLDRLQPELQKVSKELASISVVADIQAEQEHRTKDYEMLKLEQPSIARSQDEAHAELQVTQKELETAQTLQARLKRAHDQTKAGVEQGKQTQAALLDLESDLDQVALEIDLLSVRLETGAQKVNYLASQQEVLSQRTRALLEEIRRQKTEVQMASRGRPSMELAARNLELQGTRRALQAQIDRLMEDIADREQQIRELEHNPVRVERW